MDDRAAHLISLLGLTPHPEGGHFREIFRSPLTVHVSDGRTPRSALTTIYYLLTAGDVSRWHRVASDEVWHYCEGDPLELFTMTADRQRVEQTMLGQMDDAARPALVVPANVWQAARTTGIYTLVACTVGPGFDFADFQMLRDSRGERDFVDDRFAEFAAFL